MQGFLIVLFRWIHLASACVAVGGVFFAGIVLPVGLKTINPDAAESILLRTRRVFKMVLHTCILLFLVSGTYNAAKNWSKYTAMNAGLGHSLFGIHLLLALIVFGILLWLYAGKALRRDHQRWLLITLALMFFTIAAASVLKYARESAAKTPPVLLTLPR